MSNGWLVVALVLCLLLTGLPARGAGAPFGTSTSSSTAAGTVSRQIGEVDGAVAKEGGTIHGSPPPSTTVTVVPPAGGAPETCANGTPANPFPVSFLPHGYLTPNLFGLGAGSSGLDDICYTGGRGGVVSNNVNFSSVGGAQGVVGFPHVEYGQDLWGGSPGSMSPGFVLPEPVSNATNSSLWLTNSYAVNDSRGAAAYDYVWDNFLSSYVPNPGNTSGPTNYSMEVMLWMSTGLEGSPFVYFPYEGTTSLPTLINATLSDQPWDFSHFCQGTDNSELTVLYFYNGTGGAMNTSSRTFGVNFSAVLLNINQEIRANAISCWGYPNNNDVHLYLDDLNLGSEFLTPFPSPYYGQAMFDWTLSSMCFTFPEGVATVTNVSCAPVPGQPLAASPTATPKTGVVPLLVDFAVAPTGGVPPYSYNWSFGDGTYSTAKNPVHLYDAQGQYAVNLTVNDSNLTSIERHLTVDVSPTPLQVTISASALSGPVPLTIDFSATVSGGDAPYSYHWEVATRDLGVSATASDTFQTAGTYAVYLWVNDSSAPTAQANHTFLSVVALPAIPHPGPFSLTEDEFFALGAAIILLAGGLLVAVTRRRTPPTAPLPPDARA